VSQSDGDAAHPVAAADSIRGPVRHRLPPPSSSQPPPHSPPPPPTRTRRPGAADPPYRVGRFVREMAHGRRQRD
jgi:hypothetical protein